jgi:hypothetical protein
MSVPAEASIQRARFGWIRPSWFIAGVALGSASLGFLGWSIGRTDIHPGFVRFHSMISPEGGYYPTLDEMTSIVRAKAKPGQVLVIVGGNSVLMGIWQRDVDIWSARLQELLGDKYCVVNFAYRGAAPPEGGAVVAESLRKEFPRQILIANDGVLTAVAFVGHGPYRYLFWQAYFSGKLESYPARERRVAEYRGLGPTEHNELAESRISAWFDQVFHFNDLWNWVTLRCFGTLPSYKEQYFPLFLKPHGIYPDPEVDGSEPMYESNHYPPSTLDVELRIVTGPAPYYSKGSDGRWSLADATHKDLLEWNQEAFPQELKRRTLILVSGSSPYYVSRLSADSRSMLRQATDDTVSLFREAGISSFDYGWDFEPKDFGDRTHLTKFGGWKLAGLVAPQVREMAERLGYLK